MKIKCMVTQKAIKMKIRPVFLKSTMMERKSCVSSPPECAYGQEIIPKISIAYYSIVDNHHFILPVSPFHPSQNGPELAPMLYILN